MAGLFIFATFVVALILFFTATPTGKVAAGIGCVLGLVIGSSAGIAHSGGATNASLLFAAIGVIVGSMVWRNPLPDAKVFKDGGDNGQEVSYRSSTTESRSGQGSTNCPKSTAEDSASKERLKRRDEGGRSSRISPVAETENPYYEEYESDGVISSVPKIPSSLSAVSSSREPRASISCAIAEEAEKGLKMISKRLEASIEFQKKPDFYRGLAAGSLMSSFERLATAKSIPQFDLPDMSEKMFGEFTDVCLARSLPTLDRGSVDKSSMEISMIYAILASGLFEDGSKQKMLNEKIRGNVAKINGSIARKGPSVVKEIAYLGVVHGKVRSDSIDGIHWFYNLL